MRSLLFLLFPLAVFAENLPVDVIKDAASSLESSGSINQTIDSRENIREAQIAKDQTVRRAAALKALRNERQSEVDANLTAIETGSATDAEKYFARAFNLLRLAFDARAAGDRIAAQRGARLAWESLDKAEPGFADNPKKLSELQALRGTLTEEFLGTDDDALVYFSKALALNPDNSNAGEKIEKATRRRLAEQGASAPSTTEVSSLKP